MKSFLRYKNKLAIKKPLLHLVGILSPYMNKFVGKYNKCLS